MAHIPGPGDYATIGRPTHRLDPRIMDDIDDEECEADMALTDARNILKRAERHFDQRQFAECLDCLAEFKTFLEE